MNALTSRASGIELLLQRRSPNGLSGWLTYSYGVAREENRLTGERYDADFDQRHALALYAQFRISERTAVAAKFRTSTNFPIAGYVEELGGTADRPVPDDAPGAVRGVGRTERRAIARLRAPRPARRRGRSSSREAGSRCSSS